MRNILFVSVVAAMLVALLALRIAPPVRAAVTKSHNLLTAQIGPVGFSVTISS